MASCPLKRRVYSGPNTSTGAKKRSISDVHGDSPGWDVTSPMMNPSCSSLRLPFEHYAVIYLDNEGKLKIAESISIREHNSTIFTPEVRQNFLQSLVERIGLQSPLPRRQKIDSPRGVRPRRRNTPDFVPVDCPESESHILPLIGSNGMVKFRIGDTKKVISFYEHSLERFLQRNCCKIAKEFIKLIEPQKQARHPYNGGKSQPDSAPGTNGDPEKTKPQWWPQGVMHKEPDHLGKAFRIELLLHIIRKLRSQGITADRLREVVDNTKSNLQHPSHAEIIYEVLRVRKIEERYERGEVDGSMIVHVMKRGPSAKDGGEEEFIERTTTSSVVEEKVEEQLMIPTSTVKEAVAHVQTVPAGSPRPLYGSFSIPESPVLEKFRQDWTDNIIPPQFMDAFSQPIFQMPVTAKMVRRHDVSVPASTTFPTSSPDQPPTFAPAQYDTWGHQRSSGACSASGLQ